MSFKFNTDDDEHLVGVLRARHSLDEFKNANLDPSFSRYTADPLKLKDEFQALSNLLTDILWNLRKSGNGDGPVEDETSLKVFCSYVGTRYCRGDMAVFYAYTVFVEEGLLESASAEMPRGTTADGSKAPKCSDSGTLESKTGKKAATTADGLHAVADSLQKPVVISMASEEDEDTKAEKVAKRQHAETVSEGAKLELGRLKEEEFSKTMAAIEDFQARGQEPPSWMHRKLKKLENDLEYMWT